MLYILDTDHVSLLQRQHPNVIAKLAQIPKQNRAIVDITAYELLRGRMALISRAKTEEATGRGLVRLQETITFLSGVTILSYDAASQAQYENLRLQKIRVGTQDMRIAAATMRYSAILVTRNQRDFGRIPNLRFENWADR